MSCFKDISLKYLQKNHSEVKCGYVGVVRHDNCLIFTNYIADQWREDSDRDL